MLKKLRASYPQYDRSITFILIDWDAFAGHAVTTSRKIPHRSTMVLIQGGAEIGRLVSQTSEQKIKAFLDKGLR